MTILVMCLWKTAMAANEQYASLMQNCGKKNVLAECDLHVVQMCGVVLVGLTESDRIQHPSVGRSTNALVDDADAVLHSTFHDIFV